MSDVEPTYFAVSTAIKSSQSPFVADTLSRFLKYSGNKISSLLQLLADLCVRELLNPNLASMT